MPQAVRIPVVVIGLEEGKQDNAGDRECESWGYAQQASPRRLQATILDRTDDLNDNDPYWANCSYAYPGEQSKAKGDGEQCDKL